MRICFVSPFAYPLFESTAPGRFGGSEVRALTFARGLLKFSDCQVAFAVHGPTWPAFQDFDGIEVWNLPEDREIAHVLRAGVRQHLRRRDTFPWLSIERAVPSLAWRLPAAALAGLGDRIRKAIYFHRIDFAPRRLALARIGADIYCSMGAHHFTSEMVALCRRINRRSVVLLSSDYDLAPLCRKGSHERNVYGEAGHICHYGLAHADRIVAQTAWQQEELKRRFDRDATVIANPIDLTVASKSPRSSAEGFALWVGKSDQLKRPDLCIELARRCPDIPFVMIVNRADEDLYAAVIADAPPNVRTIEQVPLAKVEAYFREARVLVNTSATEGFPVAFLQAGKWSVPVVSLRIDPDRILARHGGGLCAGGDMNFMAVELARLWSDHARYEQMADRARAYVERHHHLDDRVRELHGVLRELMQTGVE